jgi:hypothetical protein
MSFQLLPLCSPVFFTEEYGLLWYNPLHFRRSSTFRRNTSPSTSGPNNRLNKKLSRSQWQATRSWVFQTTHHYNPVDCAFYSHSLRTSNSAFFTELIIMFQIFSFLSFYFHFCLKHFTIFIVLTWQIFNFNFILYIVIFFISPWFSQYFLAWAHHVGMKTPNSIWTWLWRNNHCHWQELRAICSI